MNELSLQIHCLWLLLSWLLLFLFIVAIFLESYIMNYSASHSLWSVFSFCVWRILLWFMSYVLCIFYRETGPVLLRLILNLGCLSHLLSSWGYKAGASTPSDCVWFFFLSWGLIVQLTRPWTHDSPNSASHTAATTRRRSHSKLVILIFKKCSFSIFCGFWDLSYNGAEEKGVKIKFEMY